LPPDYLSVSHEREVSKCQLWIHLRKPLPKSIDSTQKFAGNAGQEMLQPQSNAESAEARIYAGRKENW